MKLQDGCQGSDWVSRCSGDRAFRSEYKDGVLSERLGSVLVLLFLCLLVCSLRKRHCFGVWTVFLSAGSLSFLFSWLPAREAHLLVSLQKELVGTQQLNGAMPLSFA